MHIKLTFLLHFYMTDDLNNFKLYFTIILCLFNIILKRLFHTKITKNVSSKGISKNHNKIGKSCNTVNSYYEIIL